MKPSELSIGDWVCAAVTVINGEERLTPPMRVVAIGETWVYLEIDPEQGDPFDENIKDIRPILLTADILLANGWRLIPFNRYRMEFRESGEIKAAIEVEILDNGSIYADVWKKDYSLHLPARRIHELQHALRLAGIEKEIEL